MRQAFLLLALSVALGVIGAAGASSAGTWTGTVGATRFYGPAAAYRPSARLVIGSAGVTATFTGLTGASHDAPSLTTTCTIHYRQLRADGRWIIYLQRGAVTYTGRGYVKNAPCESMNYDALRVTPVGPRLRADFAGYSKARGEPIEFDWNGATQGAFRGYLHRE